MEYNVESMAPLPEPNVFQKFWRVARSPNNSRTVGVLAILVLALSVPLTIAVLHQQTNTQQHAAGLTGQVQIINPITGAEFPNAQVFNPDAVYLKIDLPENPDGTKWTASAAQTNQKNLSESLVPKAYAAGISVIGIPSCSDTDSRIAWTWSGGSNYDTIVLFDNTEAKQQVFQPSSTQTSFISAGLNQGHRYALSVTDESGVSGESTEIVSLICQGSPTATPLPTPTTGGGGVPTATTAPPSSGGKTIQNIRVETIGGSTGGNVPYTITRGVGSFATDLANMQSGKFYWQLHNDAGQQAVKVTFTATDRTPAEFQSNPVLVFTNNGNVLPDITNVSPAANTTIDFSVHPEGLTFSWNPVPGATKYRIIVSSNSDGTNPGSQTIKDNNCPNVPIANNPNFISYAGYFVCKEGGATSYTVATNNFTNGKQYDYLVEAMDDNGHYKSNGWNLFTVSGVPATPPTATTAPGTTTIPPPGTTTTPPVTGGTKISFKVNLEGIGSGGNNGGTITLGINNDPQTKTLGARIQLYAPDVNPKDTTVTPIVNVFIPAALIYQNGTYVANDIDLGVFTPISGDKYQVLIKVDKNLRKKFPGIQTIKPGITNPLTPSVITLVSGDINNNNRMDVQDYDDYRKCFQNPNNTTLSCITTDLNNDGKIDTILDNSDYKILLNSFSNQEGD